MNKELIGIKRNYNKFGYVVKEEYWYHGDDYEHKTKMIKFCTSKGILQNKSLILMFYF